MSLVIPIGRAPLNKPKKKPVIYKCACCGSEDIVRDARAGWDVQRQAWMVKACYDDAAECVRCDSETTLICEEIPM